jgi:hypothetical protein
MKLRPDLTDIYTSVSTSAAGKFQSAVIKQRDLNIRCCAAKDGVSFPLIVEVLFLIPSPIHLTARPLASEKMLQMKFNKRTSHGLNLHHPSSTAVQVPLL